MVKRIDKTWIRITTVPTLVDITLGEIHPFLISLGFVCYHNGGSHRKYKHPDIPRSNIQLSPHSEKAPIKAYQIVQLRDTIRDLNLKD